MYAFEIKLLGNFGKGIRRARNFVFSTLKLFFINKFNEGFPGAFLEIPTERCTICPEEKGKLVYRYFFKIVVVNVGDYLVNEKRSIDAVLAVFTEVVLSYKTYKKILEKNLKHLLRAVELMPFFLHIVYRYVVWRCKNVSPLLYDFGEFFYAGVGQVYRLARKIVTLTRVALDAYDTNLRSGVCRAG